MQNVQKAEKKPSKTATVPPFPATCRAKAIVGIIAYSRCLVDVSVHCGYRSSLLPNDNFCFHSRHLDIVAGTNAAS
jgi:hypothetical protein